jgi:hypothetical protein
MDYTSLFMPVQIPASSWKIGYDDQILLMGSCFADSMCAKLHEHYFRVEGNPFGVLYNPASIAMAIEMARKSQTIEDKDLVEHGGLWHSMAHHGVFSDIDMAVVLDKCNGSIVALRQALENATVITITFGTAWVYEYAGKVVGNCHKIPANQFVRRRMTVEEIVATWQPLVEAMPDKKWLFTVSPIRHVKDGLHENHINKGILLQAVEQLTKQSGCSYFPAYEIMLDELRDYRYYAEDMVHPSSMAVEYIWQRLVETYMTADTQAEMKTLHQLWRDEHHRFIHPDSMEAKRFIERLGQKKHELQEDYPWIE